MRFEGVALAAMVLGASVAGCDQGPTAPAEPVPSGPQASVVSAALPMTTSQKLPFQQTFFVPCAAGGAGEPVEFTGTIHFLAHESMSATGNAVYKLQYQPQKMVGIGLVTGDTYQGTGAQHVTETVRGDGLPYEGTWVLTQGLIGAGPGNNLLIRERIHVTINNNGDITTDFHLVDVRCF